MEKKRISLLIGILVLLSMNAVSAFNFGFDNTQTTFGFPTTISNYVPYIGATSNLDLGNYNFSVNGLVGIGTTTPQNKLNEIGRASCRERV